MADYPLSNRDLSWLEFNARVLREAQNPAWPLLERLKFLGIVSSNFDEFFMVRVASLKASIRRGERSVDSQGTSPRKLLEEISNRTREIHAAQYACLIEEVLPGLSSEGIEIGNPRTWTPAERRYLENYFSEYVLPLLTPMRMESDSFPAMGNLLLHCAFELVTEEGEVLHAAVRVPRNLGRFVPLPLLDGEDPAKKAKYALVEDLIASFAEKLFPGHRMRTSIVFKVTRDADSGVDEDREEDFLAAMEEVLAGRQNSTPVRLSISGRAPGLVALLQAGLGLGEIDTYRVKGPIDLAGFYELASMEDQQRDRREAWTRLRDKPWKPIVLPGPEGATVWDEIDRQDRLLHLPYESFDAVTRFLDEAADDPRVLAIKMTLYRTTGESPIVKALIRAARKGKQVAVVVELKARFDEERNISWASTLEQAGAIVTYGVARLKVHAKAALVIRRSQDGSIRKYLHLSTGNYNERTAMVYSDLSLFTTNEDLCREVSALFNMLTGYSTIQPFVHLGVAPFDLKKRLVSLIEREALRSTPEAPGSITAKLNALSDSDIATALYEAAKAGVRIRLNVRGVCTLIPGIPGLSETIEVRSVLGRYLEHARILRFGSGGSEEIFLSSADWLPRNLERRVELMFPVLDERLKKACDAILDWYFADNSHAYRLLPDGSWEPVAREPGAKRVYAQEELYKRVKRLAEIAEAPAEQLTVRRRFKTRG
ncbi:MAG TPA: polyphosphate kinase 1 [Rectinemataceae bacterium]